MPLTRIGTLLFAAVVVASLGGCNVWQNRAEFAPPESRWPGSQPSPNASNAPPPPLNTQYCYRTLAQVDCYYEAKPERLTGYSGVYPDPDSIVTPAKK